MFSEFSVKGSHICPFSFVRLCPNLEILYHLTLYGKIMRKKAEMFHKKSIKCSTFKMSDFKNYNYVISNCDFSIFTSHNFAIFLLIRYYNWWKIFTLKHGCYWTNLILPHLCYYEDLAKQKARNVVVAILLNQTHSTLAFTFCDILIFKIQSFCILFTHQCLGELTGVFGQTNNGQSNISPHRCLRKQCGSARKV